MAARHDGGVVGHASRLWEKDERQDRADEGEDGADAQGRGVSFVEGAVDRACAERDHQLWKDDGNVEDANGETLATALLSGNLRHNGPRYTEQHLRACNNSTIKQCKQAARTAGFRRTASNNPMLKQNSCLTA